MVTRTQARSSNRINSNSQRSAFSWSENAGPILGAAIAGAAIGFAANYGRKALMQGIALPPQPFINIRIENERVR